MKSTEENETNAFYISSNELSVMERLKTQYFVYRVYKVKASKPKVFVLGYEDFKDKIDLKVDSYKANIKEGG